MEATLLYFLSKLAHCALAYACRIAFLLLENGFSPIFKWWTNYSNLLFSLSVSFELLKPFILYLISSSYGQNRQAKSISSIRTHFIQLRFRSRVLSYMLKLQSKPTIPPASPTFYMSDGGSWNTPLERMDQVVVRHWWAVSTYLILKRKFPFVFLTV